MEKVVEKGLTYWQILGIGLIYLGFIVFTLIIVSVFLEYYHFRKELKRQKEKSKPVIRQMPTHFDKKI